MDLILITFFEYVHNIQTFQARGDNSLILMQDPYRYEPIRTL